ncbi:unnamed protein product, partial [Laminaria digitata]
MHSAVCMRPVYLLCFSGVCNSESQHHAVQIFQVHCPSDIPRRRLYFGRFSRCRTEPRLSYRTVAVIPCRVSEPHRFYPCSISVCLESRYFSTSRLLLVTSMFHGMLIVVVLVLPSFLLFCRFLHIFLYAPCQAISALDFAVGRGAWVH